MFRRNSMMFTLAMATATACTPDFSEPHETAEPAASTGEDDEDDDTGATTGADTGEGDGTTGDPNDAGESSGGDASGDAPIQDSDGDVPPADPPGDGLACEGQPCATDADCDGVDDLVCLPIVGSAPTCVAACLLDDPAACDGQPERCTAVVGAAAVCMPPIPKVLDEAGDCVPQIPGAEEPPEDPPGGDVACEGDPCVTDADCSGPDELVCLLSATPLHYCVEPCDPDDAHTCDGRPERCIAVDGVTVCLPAIKKAPNDVGACERVPG